MLDLTIADDFAAAGVTVNIGCVECRVGVAESSADLTDTLARQADERRAALASTPVAEVPQIASARRPAFKSALDKASGSFFYIFFGVRGGRHKLLRESLRGGDYVAIRSPDARDYALKG